MSVSSIRSLWRHGRTFFISMGSAQSYEIGEGNGNPLQCSCLENPREGGAWWAAVYGVQQSWTRLKWLSSSHMKCLKCWLMNECNKFSPRAAVKGCWSHPSSSSAFLSPKTSVEVASRKPDEHLSKWTALTKWMHPKDTSHGPLFHHDCKITLSFWTSQSCHCFAGTTPVKVPQLRMWEPVFWNIWVHSWVCLSLCLLNTHTHTHTHTHPPVSLLFLNSRQYILIWSR